MNVQDLSGVLFFPVTPFTAIGTVDAESLAEHLRRGLAAGAGGVFAGCGTGEFHALDVGEYRRVVHTAVEVTGGAVPVFAGAGVQEYEASGGSATRSRSPRPQWRLL